MFRHSIYIVASLLLLGAAWGAHAQTQDVEGTPRIPIKNRSATDKPSQELKREMPGNAPIELQRFQRYRRDDINRETAERPVDYMIYSERGDMIEVKHERFHTGEALDRCEVEFKLASSIRTSKAFVLSKQPYVIDPRSPGVLKTTVYTGFDYESFDKRRPSTAEGRRRDRPFYRRARPAQNTQREIAFYRSGELLDADRVQIRNRKPLNDVLTHVELGRETFIRLYPGYRVTLTWMTE